MAGVNAHTEREPSQCSRGAVREAENWIDSFLSRTARVTLRRTARFWPTYLRLIHKEVLWENSRRPFVV